MRSQEVQELLENELREMNLSLGPNAAVFVKFLAERYVGLLKGSERIDQKTTANALGIQLDEPSLCRQTVSRYLSQLDGPILRMVSEYDRMKKRARTYAWSKEFSVKVLGIVVPFADLDGSDTYERGESNEMAMKDIRACIARRMEDEEIVKFINNRLGATSRQDAASMVRNARMKYQPFVRTPDGDTNEEINVTDGHSVNT